MFRLLRRGAWPCSPPLNERGFTASYPQFPQWGEWSDNLEDGAQSRRLPHHFRYRYRLSIRPKLAAEPQESLQDWYSSLRAPGSPQPQYDPIQ